MTTRRTLDQALGKNNLSKAALAFVKDGTSKPGETIELSGNSDVELPRGTPNEALSRTKGGKDFPLEANEPEAAMGTVSMTFRVPSELCARLLRVSLNRKLKRITPFTQQGIIAEALAVWLSKQDRAD